MKESDLKRILTTPTTDEAMDKNITQSLLNIESDMDDNTNRGDYNTDSRNLFKKGYRFSKVAIIVFALAIIGTGTGVAAGIYYTKSYPFKMEFMTEEEAKRELGSKGEESLLHGEETIRESFGGGNKKISFPWANNEDVSEISDDGVVIFNDGSTFVPPYIPDPERHEKAKISGNDAFDVLGYPDLLPSYIYDNYVLGESGFVCNDLVGEDYNCKWLFAEFFEDAYDTGAFDETIWVNFHGMDVSTENLRGILIDDNTSEDHYEFSTYTTEGGILCSIREHYLGSITVDIVFDSDIIGNGHLMLEFFGFRSDEQKEKIKEILETLPLSDELIDFQNLDIEGE